MATGSKTWAGDGFSMDLAALPRSSQELLFRCGLDAGMGIRYTQAYTPSNLLAAICMGSDVGARSIENAPSARIAVQPNLRLVTPCHRRRKSYSVRRIVDRGYFNDVCY